MGVEVNFSMSCESHNTPQYYGFILCVKDFNKTLSVLFAVKYFDIILISKIIFFIFKKFRIINFYKKNGLMDSIEV